MRARRGQEALRPTLRWQGNLLRGRMASTDGASARLRRKSTTALPAEGDRGTAGLFSPPRGTRDLVGREVAAHRFVTGKARRTALLWGCKEVRTPIFEHTALFSRGFGPQSDVVNKEMYTFNDKAGNSVSLRPENTAGVVRAFVNNADFGSLPHRFFYSGPMFRYERPQKGRFRQFHQVGVEVLGVDSAYGDVEVIQMACHFLWKELALSKNVVLHINSLGDEESRINYRKSLRAYLHTHSSSLSADSLERLQRGAELRILDSKDPQDVSITDAAACPLLLHHLNQRSNQRFRSVCRLLEALHVPYQINPRLVRGLDYYSDIVFEFIDDSGKLGRQQGTVLAGGRYPDLVKQLGGPNLSGLGWAAGVERLAELIDSALVPTPARHVALIVAWEKSTECEAAEYELSPHESSLAAHALDIAIQLRVQGLTVLLQHSAGHSPSALTKQLRRAVKAGAVAAVFIGAQEREQGTLTIKLLESGA